MVQLKKLAVLVVLLAAPALLFAQAQDQAATQQPADQSQAQTPAVTADAGDQAAGMNLRLSEAIGIALKSEAGDVEGTLNDLVISPEGDITHAVVAFTAPADAANQDQYLVPADRINVGATGTEAMLSISAAEIQSLQKLENGQLPADLTAGAAETAAAAPEAPAAEAPAAEAPAAPADQGAVAQAPEAPATGAEAPAAEAPAAPADQGAVAQAPEAPAAGAEAGAVSGHYLATQLQGVTVMGGNDQELGTVQDAMMDLSAKKVLYIALTPAGVLGLGDRMFAIPVDQISSIDMGQGRIMANINQDQLKSNEGFSQSDWPAQAPDWGATQ